MTTHPTLGPIDPIDLDALRGHTPGPWEWVEGTRGPRLSTPDRGKLIVMDFVRCGMQGAQPRFARWDGIGEGSPRTRMGGILTKGTDHPDARLIAAAPALLAELTARRARDAEVGALVDAASDFAATLEHSIAASNFGAEMQGKDQPVPDSHPVRAAIARIDAALLPFQRSDDKGDAT
jgi:hypothetical protein